jgi:hypothetical protein
MPNNNRLSQAADIAATVPTLPIEALPEILRPFIISSASLAALNQAAATLSLFTRQANLVYSCRLMARPLDRQATSRRVSVTGWFDTAAEQIAKQLNLTLSEATSLAWTTLLNLAGLWDEVDFDTRLVPILGKLGRLSPAIQSLSSLLAPESTSTVRLAGVRRGGQWAWAAGYESEESHRSCLGVRVVLDWPDRQEAEGVLPLNFSYVGEANHETSHH